MRLVSSAIIGKAEAANIADAAEAWREGNWIDDIADGNDHSIGSGSFCDAR